jgi:hypothetical protein
VRVDPAIAALRRDRAPQRRAQAAMVAACDAWRDSPEAGPALAELGRYGTGATLASCPALNAIFAAGDSAPAFVGALVHGFCRTLAREPFGHPPLRHGFESGNSTLLLARSGRAQIVLHAREPGRTAFASVAFRDAGRHQVALAGRARARLVHRIGPGGQFEERTLLLRPGERLEMDLSRETLQVLEVERRVVTLRLDRTAERPGPVRQYALADGAMWHQSAGDIRTSRHEAMLALLARMGRDDAVPVLARIAVEAGDDSLRWQALRECLALDTAAGYRALCAVARAGSDPLAGPAAALHAQLAEAHPSLPSLEAKPCPA